MTTILFRTTVIIGLSVLALGSEAQTTAPSIKKPTLQKPNVAAPAAPTKMAPPVSNATPQASGAMVAPAFNDAAFKRATDSDAVVFLVFSQAGDSVWETQAPLTKTILQEPEFNRIASFEVDLKSADLATRFSVTTPGTILIMKGGVERIRSQRMVKADVIRKMLRLHTAL